MSELSTRPFAMVKRPAVTGGGGRVWGRFTYWERIVWTVSLARARYITEYFIR